MSPETISNDFKNKTHRCIPDSFKLHFKNKTQGIPEIFSNYFKNETQGVLGIVSNYFKNKTRDPRDSFKLSQKQNKGFPETLSN